MSARQYVDFSHMFLYLCRHIFNIFGQTSHKSPGSSLRRSYKNDKSPGSSLRNALIFKIFLIYLGRHLFSTCFVKNPIKVPARRSSVRFHIYVYIYIYIEKIQKHRKTSKNIEKLQKHRKTWKTYKNVKNIENYKKRFWIGF